MGGVMGESEPAVHQAPRFDEQDALRLARELFAIRASARSLPSERDQNFHLTTDSGEQFVLKIANAGERREVLDLQNRTMQHLAGNHVIT